jgi:ligand-binding sensor domain-containing protein
MAVQVELLLFNWASSAKAVNYSSVDETCKGVTSFKNLKKSNLLDYTLKSDDPSFDISSVQKGESGTPLMKELAKELQKISLSDKRGENLPTTNIADDEPIWIIQTKEGRLVKFIVPKFPAKPRPNSNRLH